MQPCRLTRKPTAAFDADVTSCVFPLEVQFTGTTHLFEEYHVCLRRKHERQPELKYSQN